MDTIRLMKMTPSMYHEFFKEFENDIDLYLDKNQYSKYEYNELKVDEYIKKQNKLERIPLAIMVDDYIAGEILIKNIEKNTGCTFSIIMKNSNYKGKGYGTKAEQLLIDYIFNELNIPVIYADAVISNIRSQHVLEKVGFKEIKRDNQYIYYEIDKKRI